MQMRDASRITRNSTTHGHDTIVQIMHINQRIRIKTQEAESLSNFFQKVFYHLIVSQIVVQLILYFEIEQGLNQLGLLERKGKGKYEFISEKGDIQPDHLYYLYFKEKPDKISPSHNLEEETKKSKSQYSNSPTTNSGSLSRRYNNSYSQFQGVSLSSSQIEKVKRPKDEKKILICPFEKCLKEFSETGNLKTHMRTHTGERPFVCQQCGQQFITKGHLQAHELTHTGEKPFNCNFQGCNKRYSRAGRLKIHQRLHTGERPFVCQMEGCEKAFREKGNLLTHMRIHNGQKPFRCDFADCDMMFTTQGHLTDHKRRHSGERPYICEVCNDKFMRSSTLKIHMRRHTGEKPYKCDKCDRAFSESGNLRTHLKTHEDERFDCFSPLGKRMKRESKFSTPRSGFSSKKRTLKAISKNNMHENNFSEEPYSPDSIKPMPQLQLDFKANHNSHNHNNNNIQLRKGSGQINSSQNQGQMIQRQNHPAQSPIKEEDIKIPLVKQDNAMANENYGNFLINLNEPQSVTQSYIQQQPSQQGLLLNPFSPSSILNQNQLSQFSSPRFSQYHQQHQHLLTLNTPTDTNAMRINARKIQNQQPIQQFQDIKKMQQNQQYIQQVNSNKFSPLGGQLSYLDSPDMNQHHHGIIVSSQVQNAKLMTDMSPLYRKNDGQVLKLGNTPNVNQIIQSQPQYQIISQATQIQAQPQIQIISSSVQGQQSTTNQEEEAQSFSSLAKFWQNRGGSQSPCVSQDASPLLRKPSMTPRNGNEWQQNYPNMQGSSLKLNNQIFNPSENSAFKRGLSPKVMIDQNGHPVIHNFNSPSNTPKLISAQEMNRQMQIRKNSSFSSFQQPQQPMHIIAAQQSHMLRPPNILTLNQQQQMLRGSLSPNNFEDMQSPGILPKHQQLGTQNQQQ